MQSSRSFSSQDFTFCICTYNSEKTLSTCLNSIRNLSPTSRILIVDHFSKDSTLDIANHFDAHVISENVGLGHARQLCFENCLTDYLVFMDSDVEVIRKDFLERSFEVLKEISGYGAVVGMSAGHKFSYGLPASLLVLRRRDFGGKIVPDYIDARETFFIQMRLDQSHLKTLYIFDAMRHNSQFRKFKPEWEGANTRVLPSPKLKELRFTFGVILLLTLNSRSFVNLAYLPIFYLKFLRGFLNPGPWMRIRRSDRLT